MAYFYKISSFPESPELQLITGGHMTLLCLLPHPGLCSLVTSGQMPPEAREWRSLCTDVINNSPSTLVPPGLALGLETI